MHSKFRLLATLLIFALAGLRMAHAQANATVEGIVTDPSGAVISGAMVTVQSSSTGIVRNATSDAAGRYIVTSLNPGVYEISAEAAGFTKKVLTGINLAVGTDERQDVQLAVGQEATTVSVQATAELVDTQQSSNGTVIENRKVVEMPLANRQFYSLALLSPAAYESGQNSTLGFRGGFNIAGVTEINNLFTVNGVFDNDMGTNQPSFRPSVENIQEFKLLTGVYAAEYGRMAGGQLLIVTKSGGNSFHGSAYEFLRNQVTDAKPYFTQAGGTTPAFKQNTFGVTTGGPIIKRKTFFFGAYEGQRIRQQIVALATVPTPAMLAGCFQIPTQMYNPSTGAALVKTTTGACAPYGSGYDVTSMVDTATGTPFFTQAGAKVGQEIAALGYPAPTYATATGSLPGNNYNFSETRQETMDEGSIRIDHTITDHDTLFGNYNYFHDPSFEPSNTLCSSYVLPNFGCYTNQISNLADITYTHIFSAAWLNEFRVGFDRLVQPRVSQDNYTIGSVSPVLAGAFTQVGVANNLGLPNTTVSGYSTVGGATNIPQDRWDNHYEIVDNVTWNHGAHTFKFGTDLLHARTTDLEVLSGRGALTFNSSNLNTDNGNNHRGTTNYSMADLLIGLPATTANNPTAPIVHTAFNGYDFFAQDDWKITPYLTLNLGLRYELDLPVYDSHNTISNFNLASGQFISGQRNPYNTDLNNFAPRLGFAWQPYKKETTVVKGGFGDFYNQPLTYNQFLQLSNQYPIRDPNTFTPGAYPSIKLNSPFPTTGKQCTGVPGSIVVPAGSTTSGSQCIATLTGYGVLANYATPYLTEWSLGVQQALTKDMVLEVTYFGSKGTRLPISLAANFAPPNTLSTQAAQTTLRAYPQFQSISMYETIGNSSYQSMQVKLQKSFTQGYSYLVAYTYGKSIDENGGVGSSSNSSGNVQNPLDVAADRGLSDFDVRHRLVFSPVAQLPFGRGKAFLNSGIPGAIAGGWQIASIVTFQTGRPFTVTNASTNISGSFVAADRPNIVPGQNPNAGPHTVAEWFNTAAFTSNLPGQFGNAGRNIIEGPGYVDWDATLSRFFPVFERLQGEFRVEAFDLLNHPNFFNPLSQGTQFGSGNAFGTITQANNNRELQFGLRLTF